MDRLSIVLFDGFEELDAIGPYEVFGTAAAVGGDVAVDCRTLDPADRVRASHGLRVEPDGILDDADPDLLVVPGGGWSSGGGVRDAVEDGRLPKVVAERHATGTPVASVCTGAMILAAGGLLDDRPAITHASAIDDLSEYADVVDARVVDDGDILSAGGVTAGIDLALHIVERRYGTAIADRTTEVLEHDRTAEVFEPDRE